MQYFLRRGSRRAVAMSIFVLAGVLLLPSPASGWPSISRPFRWGCTVALAAVVVGTGVYLQDGFTEGPDAALTTPATEVPSGGARTADLRAFEERLGNERRTQLALRDGGRPYRLTVLTGDWFKRTAASNIKQAVKERFPNTPESELGMDTPGLHIPISALSFEEEAGAIRIYLVSGELKIKAKETVTREALLSGATLHVPLEPEVQKSKQGSVRFTAKFALRYDPDRGHFELLEGQGTVVVDAPRPFASSEPFTLPKLVTTSILDR